MTKLSRSFVPTTCSALILGLSLGAIAQEPVRPPVRPTEPQPPQRADQAAVEAAALKFVAGDEVVGREILESVHSTDGAARQQIGQIVDFGIDRSTGAITLFGIEVDDTVHAVPASAVRWIPQDDVFVCAISKDGMSKVAHAVEGNLNDLKLPGSAAGEASATSARARAAEASSTRAGSKLLCYSAMSEMALHRGDQELAGDAQLMVEPSTGHVAFLVVDVGGVLGIGSRRIPIPMAAVEVQDAQVEDSGDDVPAARWTIDLTDEELGKRPSIAIEGGLDAPAFRRAIYAAWQVDAPAWDSLQEEAPAEGAKRDDGTGRRNPEPRKD